MSCFCARERLHSLCQLSKDKFTCTRCDADEASDHSLDRADHGAFLVHYHVKGNPHQEASGSAYMGVDNGQRCNQVCCKWRATIEPCPSKPQKPCSSQHVNYVVWREMLPVMWLPWSYLYDSNIQCWITTKNQRQKQRNKYYTWKGFGCPYQLPNKQQ